MSGEDAGNPDVECQKIEVDTIKELVDYEDLIALNELNQYCVDNAWFKVNFGGCKYGIFSAACPIEPLHAIENGIIPKCIEILFKEQIKSTSHLARLDGLVQELLLLPKQRLFSSGSETAMPRLQWRRGITGLANLTASERVGVMFTIVVIGITKKGEEFFIDVFKDLRKWRDMLQCFQMLLCYWMWLKKDTYWKCNSTRETRLAKEAIRTMLKKIKQLWPRFTGQQWDLPKFHEQLHVPDDINRNGAPKGSHTGPTEHNHIVHIKNPSKTTQGRRETLDHQIAERWISRSNEPKPSKCSL